MNTDLDCAAFQFSQKVKEGTSRGRPELFLERGALNVDHGSGTKDWNFKLQRPGPSCLVSQSP